MGACLDRHMEFVAVVLSRRVPTTVPDIVRLTTISRAMAYRLIEAMEYAGLITYAPGKSRSDPGHIRVNRRALGVRP